MNKTVFFQTRLTLSHSVLMLLFVCQLPFSCTSHTKNKQRENAELRFIEWIAVADSNMAAWNVDYSGIPDDSLVNEVQQWERYCSRIIEATDSAAQIIAPYDSILSKSAMGVHAFAADALFYARMFLYEGEGWGVEKCSVWGGHTSMALQDVHDEITREMSKHPRKHFSSKGDYDWHQ